VFVELVLLGHIAEVVLHTSLADAGTM
jgi:hypothetical protein